MNDDKNAGGASVLTAWMTERRGSAQTMLPTQLAHRHGTSTPYPVNQSGKPLAPGHRKIVLQLGNKFLRQRFCRLPLLGEILPQLKPCCCVRLTTQQSGVLSGHRVLQALQECMLCRVILKLHPSTYHTLESICILHLLTGVAKQTSPAVRGALALRLVSV